MSLLAPNVILVAPQRLAHHLAAADVAPGFDLLVDKRAGVRLSS